MTAPSSSLPLAVPLADRAGRVLWFGTAFQVAWLVICAAAYPFETRMVNDINVWTKPLKFQASLSLMLLTVWLLLPLLPAAVRAARHVRISCTLLVLAAALDTLVFTLQSARGTASHFNEALPLDALLYYSSGIAALTMVMIVAWIGWLLWQHRPHAGSGAPRGMVLGSAWGLMLGGLTTLLTAGAMSFELVSTGHWVGGELTDARGLPILGWSTTGGDLRVPHFFATHLMQALPLLGWLLDRWAPARLAATGLWVGASLGVALVAGTFVQAVMGLPFMA